MVEDHKSQLFEGMAVSSYLLSDYREMNAKLMRYFMVVSVNGKSLFDVNPVIKYKMLLIYLAIFHSHSMFDSFTHNIIYVYVEHLSCI
ncbi:hypothetical protein CE195_05835 [Sodalis-like symbiont of Philaenus spumarius]|nr:hypothetical protein CE195_05835 [Sodalis-like symbiont of Philaenus spumarius]